MNQMIEKILQEIEKVIVGKNENVEKILMAILASGHVLMEDVPGVGKTTTAMTFAKVLGLETRRVQFTSDTVPSDIIGFSVYDKETSEFVYKPGAVMTNLLLADEINRTSSKTQSALLEAMEERHVTVDGKAYAFTAKSGVGKSTHTRLWREHIDGAVLLNDDSPMLRVEDGKVWAYGSAWSGKTPCYKQEKYPLAACVRLSQAPYNKMHKLHLLKGYAALHPSCPPEFAYDERIYSHISTTLGALLKIVPCWHLECLPDADAALMSYNTIFDR